MSGQPGHPLLVILPVAAFAPLIGELLIKLRLPIVVMEVALGIVVGPYALDLAQPTGKDEFARRPAIKELSVDLLVSCEGG